MTPCALCETPVDEDQDHLRIGTMAGASEPVHRECMLRSVLGGIGHVEDHQFWCLTMHDPDGGKTYRESALSVDQWVREQR